MAVSRDQYGFVHSRLSKALAPDLTDADALLAAEEDWRDDTGAEGANETGHMKFEAYAESLFGLADMWAAPSEEAYLEFLQKELAVGAPANKRLVEMLHTLICNSATDLEKAGTRF